MNAVNLGRVGLSMLAGLAAAALPAMVLAVRWRLVGRHMDRTGRRSYALKAALLVGLGAPASALLSFYGGALALPMVPSFAALLLVASVLVRRAFRR